MVTLEDGTRVERRGRLSDGLSARRGRGRFGLRTRRGRRVRMAETMGLVRPVELKLVHADQLGRALAESIAEWTSGSSMNVRHAFLDQRLGFRLVLDGFSQSPPVEEWGLAVGDYVHNLRSALDNLAFGLARSRLDPPARPCDIAFPVYDDRGRFDRIRS